MDKQQKQPSRSDQVRAMQRQGGKEITAIMVSRESSNTHKFIDGGYSMGHACKIFNCGLPASAEVHQPPPKTLDDLAGECADKVFQHVSDLRSRDALRAALIAFAEEIKRSTVEP